VEEQQVPDGYVAPVFRALQEPVLIAGVPKKVFVVIWPVAACLAINMGAVWILVPAVAVHLVCSALTKRDPLWPSVYSRALLSATRFDPK